MSGRWRLCCRLDASGRDRLCPDHLRAVRKRARYPEVKPFGVKLVGNGETANVARLIPSGAFASRSLGNGDFANCTASGRPEAGHMGGGGPRPITPSAMLASSRSIRAERVFPKPGLNAATGLDNG